MNVTATFITILLNDDQSAHRADNRNHILAKPLVLLCAVGFVL